MITCGQPGDQLALRQFLALSTGKIIWGWRHGRYFSPCCTLWYGRTGGDSFANGNLHMPSCKKCILLNFPACQARPGMLI